MTKVKRFRGGGSSVAAAAPEDREPSRRLKSKPRPFTRTLETAEAGGNYPVKVNTPKVDTAGGNNIIKRPTSELAVKAGKSGVDVGKTVGRAARLAGRAFPIVTGALEPSELGDSSLSNKESAEMVKRGAFKQDQDSSTDTANSRAANREAIYGTQKTPEPSKPAKKDEPVAVVKKQTTVVSKPKVSAPAKSSRNSMADEWAAFSKGREADTAALKDITDRYSKTGTLVNPEDENAYTKSVAGEESEYKKGGMTKRPPKPAKKVPARKFASGGSTSRTSASKRGDGCATKGHTKGKYL
jgi:hypothetical protein